MRLPGDLRWWELLPEAVLGLGLAVFAVTETSAATSAFRSSTALALMAGAALAWLVGRIVLGRFVRWPAVRFGVFAVAAVAVLAIVVLPAYDDTTVVETLPVAAGAETTTPTSTSNSTSTSTTVSVAASPAAPTTSTTPPLSSMPPATAPAPLALRTAAIRGIDHRASGTAIVYRQPDGSLVVGLEDIDIQPGPDYDVYVVPGADQERLGDGVRLDDLRGNKGTQYYEVPAGTDITDGPWTVLVWCQTFDVPVAGATPVAA